MKNSGLMIHAIDLRHSFNDIEAILGVSFRVHHGEIFGLLGPNGAGKTTTIGLLSGQINPDGGRATVAGCDVVKDRARLKERIGVVFEEQNLYERSRRGTTCASTAGSTTCRTAASTRSWTWSTCASAPGTG